MFLTWRVSRTRLSELGSNIAGRGSFSKDSGANNMSIERMPTCTVCPNESLRESGL